MSTLFQATASFSSSRKSCASWLWLLQADKHTDTENANKSTGNEEFNISQTEMQKLCNRKDSICKKNFTLDKSFQNDSIQLGAFLFRVVDSQKMTVIKYFLDLSGKLTAS